MFFSLCLPLRAQDTRSVLLIQVLDSGDTKLNGLTGLAKKNTTMAIYSG